MLYHKTKQNMKGGFTEKKCKDLNKKQYRYTVVTQIGTCHQ